MNLATITHISDLHFGLPDPNTYDAETLRLWAAIPGFEGFLGHKYSALVFLEDFWQQRLNDDPQGYEGTKLIVSGDLTTKGNKEEFETAVEFLGNELIPPKGGGVGLGVQDWMDWTIPGNHDHWPGSIRMIGKSTPAFHNTFKATPFRTALRIPPAASAYLFRFLFIDTCKDVSRLHPDRVWARGSFVSELDELTDQLVEREKNEIRVLCLHHSQEVTGYKMGIDSVSRSELNKFIVDHEVSVLLCGHVHEPPLVKAFIASSGANTRVYLEARCGTTTQQDFQESPFYWKNVWQKAGRPFGIRLQRASNILLVYRINEDGSDLYWDSELYELRRDGFLPPRNPEPKIMVDPHFKLT